MLVIMNMENGYYLHLNDVLMQFNSYIEAENYLYDSEFLGELDSIDEYYDIFPIEEAIITEGAKL